MISLRKYFSRKSPVLEEVSQQDELALSLNNLRKILNYVSSYGLISPLSTNERSKMVRDLNELYKSTKSLLPGEREDRIKAYVERNADAFGRAGCPSVNHIEDLFASIDS
ncbi:hypothetical protein HYW74_03175 [Candidatus Pacearchaeota archaeon]|nr:hypothetical protein [Candidatus Pacearchaeota archaeon]